jgi:NADPH:quinone reductase-like Zn-dependent oxidoreductase
MSSICVSAALSALAVTSLFTAPAAQSAPAKMDAIVQSQANGADVLQMRSVDTPRPGPNQILIKVYAAAVNPVDWKRRPTETTLPSGSVLAPIPGYDVAGVVDSLGSGVTTWKAGDAVFGRVTGAFAQYAVVDADTAGAKPHRFTFEQAAGIPIAGVAGFGAAEAGKVTKGQRVAIIGAAGGAGSAAVDVVHARGAKVIASGHSSQQSWLKEQGVEEFVAYDKENVALRIKDVDVVLNMVDGQAEPALAYLKRGGTLSSIAGLPPPEKCTAAGVTCVTIRGNVPGMTAGQALAALVALADAGKYTVRVTRTYPLAEAAAAQDFAHKGETMGKIVLIVDSRSKDR